MTAVPEALQSSVAGVTDELHAEFSGLFSRSVVAQVVLAAFQSLSGQVLEGALPEMLARLARTRLTALRLEMID